MPTLPLHTAAHHQRTGGQCPPYRYRCTPLHTTKEQVGSAHPTANYLRKSKKLIFCFVLRFTPLLEEICRMCTAHHQRTGGQCPPYRCTPLHTTKEQVGNAHPTA